MSMLEDTQSVGLVREAIGLGGGVVMGDPDKHDQAGSLESAHDLAIDGDLGACGPLDDCAHGEQRAIIRS